MSLFWLCLKKNFRFSSSSAATRPATDYNLKKLLLRPPVVAISGRQNSPPITTSSADNERARKGTTNEHPGRKNSDRKRQTGNGPKRTERTGHSGQNERAIAERTNGPSERAIADRTNGPRERATVGTGAGNGPQEEWALEWARLWLTMVGLATTGIQQPGSLISDLPTEFRIYQNGRAILKGYPKAM